MVEIKLFNKWDTTQVKVNDLGLQRYINLKPILVPRTGGRNIKVQFHKSKTSIVERLINKIMVAGHKGKKHKLTSGHMAGKALNKMRFVEKVFEILEQKTKLNPVQVFVKAIENSAPRDEITTIEYGGARYPQAVDCAPQRRIDICLRMFVQGAYNKSFNKKNKFENALAEEIFKAYSNDPTSNAIAKKLELERQSDSSR